MELRCCVVIFMFTFVSLLNICRGLLYNIPEIKADKVIGNIATDANITNLENLRFSLLEKTKYEYVSYFSVNSSTGVLKSAKDIDRDVMCKYVSSCEHEITEFQLTIGVISTDIERIKVSVFVQDINDNSPTFEMDSVNISVSESMSRGESVPIDGAVDADSAPYSVVRYEVLPTGSPFFANFSKELDGSYTVHLTINKTLDREQQDHYDLDLVAFDGGAEPKTGTLKVSVTVTDYNDNPPMFTKSIYNVSVKENVGIGVSILKVRAIDFDIGDNGKIIYSLSSHDSKNINDLFDIEPVTGNLIVIGDLIFSPQTEYKIIVEASDSGSPPKTAQSTIYVHVEDTQNNAPGINVDLLVDDSTAQIPEDATVGTVVVLVTATDDDKGRNGNVSCSIDNKVFSMDSFEEDQYTVRLAQSLDRETVDQYSVNVTCTDQGRPPLNSTFKFNVTVEDRNDNQPIFTENVYERSIDENNEFGALILQVSATDYDIGRNGEITYFLGNDSESRFFIHPNEGKIYASERFDREKRDKYIFEVMASDNGKTKQFTSTATVILTIEDENDNSPVFETLIDEFWIKEGLPPFSFVGQLKASDNDVGQNKDIGYAISQYSYTSFPFTIFPDTGEIKTIAKLDREATSRYHFSVIAFDHGTERRSSTMNITVNVLDVNDNYPIIRNPKQSGDIVRFPYVTPVNTALYSIQAFDADDGDNAKFTYKIIDRNDSSIFDINDSGEILVSRPMSSSDTKTYMLNIQVSDKGVIPLTNSTKLILIVEAENITAVTSKPDEGQNQNLLIALVVVLVTVVLAVTIMVTICLIRRMDGNKEQFIEGENTSRHSDDLEVAPNLFLNGQKEFLFSPMMNSTKDSGCPSSTRSSSSASSHKSEKLNNECDQPDRYDAPSSHSSTGTVIETVDNHDKQILDSQSNTDSMPRLHRLASLRLHQALLQSHDKHWANQQDVVPNNHDFFGAKRHDDSHSQMSADTGSGTCDSGRGGSVSDMGMSHDADDLRILQLQNLVRQSGRRGVPPHKSSPRDSPRDSPLHMVEAKQSNLAPKGKVGSGIQMGLSAISNHHPAQCAYLQTCDSPNYLTQNVNHVSNENGNQNCHNNFSNFSQQNMDHDAHQNFSHCAQQNVNLDSCQNVNHSAHQNVNPKVNNAPPSYRQFQNELGLPPRRGYMDETMESVTTGYDDDDNTTTSGSYTIDNTFDDFPSELDVGQLNNMHTTRVSNFRDVVV